MDETPVWLELVGKTTIATKGAKDVPIISTGHEKLRQTVVVTARADGTKFKPYTSLYLGDDPFLNSKVCVVLFLTTVDRVG